MTKLFEETLADRIYEAAVVPEKWPSVLDEMSVAADGAGAVLFTANASHVIGITSPNLAEVFAEFVRDGWAEKNTRPVRLAAANYPGFVREQDVFSDEELDNDPVYRDFYRKRGLGWATGTMVEAPSGDSIVFSFERAFNKGPVPVATVKQFDQLRPHLVRAALLSSRLGRERAVATTNALQSIGLPGAVLFRGGRLLAANHLFEQLMPRLFQDRRDRLTLVDGGADALLAVALREDLLASGRTVVSSIPVAATEGQVPLVLHLLPICGAAHDIFARATALLVVTPVDRAIVPKAHVLQGLFDLTPAEARVARGIGEARSIDAVALSLGVSNETVRSQLKAVLAKTGLSRQQELVSLLAGKALPVPEPPKDV